MPTLEELAERLDELELHVVEETTDVVVGLDGRRRSLEADRLDDVRVQGALQEPLDLATLAAGSLDLALNLGRLLLKHLDKSVADDLALLLGVGDAGELAEEEVGRVDNGQVDAEVLAEHLVDLLGFVHAEDAVVDHDGVEAARAVSQSRVSQHTGETLRTHRSPIASCISLAATDESTPPLTAPMT